MTHLLIVHAVYAADAELVLAATERDGLRTEEVRANRVSGGLMNKKLGLGYPIKQPL